MTGATDATGATGGHASKEASPSSGASRVLRTGVPSLPAPPGAQLVDRLADHRAIVIEHAVPDETCAAWVDGVMRMRDAWTSDFGGEQYALGRAFYTHFETGRSGEYFADAAASDARVEQGAPGLQARLRQLLAELTGARVVARRGWCGAGVHVFPPREKVSEAGGVVHFDVEGLGRHHLARRKRALSLVLMLQRPEEGGGLRLWDALYQGEEHPGEEELAADSEIVEYARGDLFVFDSYRLHQIQPFAGRRERVSATLHAGEVDRGLWECWF